MKTYLKDLTREMAVLKKGEYKGKYKEGKHYYHMFSPEQIATNGEIQYVRIGDYKEEFGSNRSYTIIKPNKEEKVLISERGK